MPTSVLSTEADVTRVTAPGFKQCEGQDDSAGDGLQLDGVNPAYDLVDLRPDGFEPQVTGLEWDGDDLLVLTWGGNGNDQGNVELGELYRLEGVQDAASPADVTRTKIAGGLKEPQGIKVVDGEIYISEKTGLIKLTDEDAEGVFECREDDRDLPVRRQLPRVRLRHALQGRQVPREPVGLHQPRWRHHRAAGLARTAARTSPSTRRPARSTTSPAACAPRTAWAGVPRARSS